VPGEPFYDFHWKADAPSQTHDGERVAADQILKVASRDLQQIRGGI